LSGYERLHAKIGLYAITNEITDGNKQTDKVALFTLGKNGSLQYNIINSMNLQKTWRNNSKINNVTNRLTAVLFIIYVIALCWILLFKLGVRFSYMENRSVNLIPFSDLLINGKIDVGGVISNVVIFVPLGIYAGTLFEKWIFRKQLTFFFLFSLLVEGLQFILAIGAFDITDVITNTLGGIIG
jgi:glycopeptide antibiotics resistance protein